MKGLVRAGLFVAASALLLSCEAAIDEAPGAPAGFTADGLADVPGGKADTLTRWFTTVMGDLALGFPVSGVTSPDAPFHGWTFDLKKGDSVTVTASGSDKGYLALYGPQGPNGKWLAPARKSWIEWDPTHHVFAAELREYTTHKGGRFLLVVGSPWQVDYAYTALVSCAGPACGDPKHCVEFETVGPTGIPLSLFKAVNAGTFEEAQAILDAAGSVLNAHINPGTCAGQPANVLPVWAPVCGMSPDTETRTYTNLEAFRVAIRQAAGDDGKAAGHWEVGACEAMCLYDGVYHPVDSPFPAADGCNTCVCLEDGSTVCTKMYCPPSK